MCTSVVFSCELAYLNTEISNRISVMEEMLSGTESTEEFQEFDKSAGSYGASVNAEGSVTESDNMLSHPEDPDDGQSSENLTSRYFDQKTSGSSYQSAYGQSKHGNRMEVAKLFASDVSKLSNTAVGSVMHNAKGASKFATHAVGSAVNMVAGDRDGEYYCGGFVSFKTLSLKYAALQMLHHDTPFLMSVSEAPDPEDVFWANVGRQHKELQLGILFSRSASVAICLLWTIPMAFFASLSTIEGLKQQFSVVEDAIEAFPALEPILQQLAPLLVVMFNSL